MPESTDPKPTADDTAATGRPDVPLLADVVEVARESFGAEEAGGNAKPTPPAPTPPPRQATAPSTPPAPGTAQPTTPPPATVQPAPIATPKTEPAPTPPRPEPKPEPQAARPAASPKPPAPTPSAPVAAPSPVLEEAPRRSSLGAWRETPQGQAQLFAYVRANPRRVLLMIVAPILAAEIALGLLSIGPTQYRAVATVNIPTDGSSVSDVAQSVSEYRSLVESPPVLRQVAAQTNVSVGQLKSGLSTKRSGTSSLVAVTYTASKRATVAPVAKAAAREGLAALIEPELEVANRGLLQAQKDFEAVQLQIVEFNASHGLLLDPPETYRAKVAELSRLKVQAQQARASGNTARAASLDAAVAQATKDVDSLAAIVRDYQRLQSQHDQLQSTINSSSARQSEANARLDAANAASTIDLGGVNKVNPITRLARGAAITFIVGLLLMVGVIALLEFLNPSQPVSAQPAKVSAPPRASARSSSSKRRRR